MAPSSIPCNSEILFKITFFFFSFVSVPDPFGTLDPFGSGAFSGGEGFADFSQMSKVKVKRKAAVLLKMDVQTLFKRV